MRPVDIKRLARHLLEDEISLDEFVTRLAAPTADLGEVALDLDRARRCGFPEVVFGEGKTVATIEKIFARLHDEGVEAFATRVDEDKADTLASVFPTARYNSLARTLRLPAAETASEATPSADAAFPKVRGRVAVVTAGTTDMPVAEEARETADWTGAEVTLVQDVGVAGPHRLPERLADIRGADAVVVVAGMEGALPSVAGGHLDCPVIAVPTSVGYGANFGGFAALLSMLNSCAANVAVVNIDAGFKGGYLAGLIARQAARGRAS
ncbi:MAG: nickel pincer cofactor biosynthesis protein LarB [Planctomycetota bacterium]|nr:MAG: nickel pincer cofactor biosynthesis protein LarB [Planctomycetota bacterium]REK43496.1 MAG: nickel pincer cofactor biosynthesis protein LarB [Planctomycetota bacterium]